MASLADKEPFHEYQAQKPKQNAEITEEKVTQAEPTVRLKHLLPFLERRKQTHQRHNAPDPETMTPKTGPGKGQAQCESKRAHDGDMETGVAPRHMSRYLPDGDDVTLIGHQDSPGGYGAE